MVRSVTEDHPPGAAPAAAAAGANRPGAAASPTATPRRGRTIGTAAGAAGAAAGSVLAAHVVMTVSAPVLHDRMLPWIVGRGLGVAAYLALTALVSLGLWFRHPWRRGTRALVGPATLLRAHAALAAATLALVVGHVTALAVDAYAHVGWSGALVPGLSHYRPWAVAAGTVALYVGVLIGSTAALAGRIVGRRWLAVHRLAVATFVLMWLHGIEAGSDVTTLRWLYVSSGVLIAVLAASRQAARRAERPLRNVP